MFYWIRQNQQTTALIGGYILVFLLAFGLGRITILMPNPPDVRIEGPESSVIINDTLNVKGAQIQSTTVAGESPMSITEPIDGECDGKIKGNVGSSGNVYHMPGGSFYDRTKAEKCFDTEQEAQKAGFRKSQR